MGMFSNIAYTNAAKADLLAAADRYAPREFAAMLGGRAVENLVTGSTALVENLLILPNTSIDNESFEIDGALFCRYEHELRKCGQMFLGFAHSHPNGTTAPSHRDRLELWPNYVQVITNCYRCDAFVINTDRTVHLLPENQRAEEPCS